MSVMTCPRCFYDIYYNIRVAKIIYTQPLGIQAHLYNRSFHSSCFLFDNLQYLFKLLGLIMFRKDHFFPPFRHLFLLRITQSRNLHDRIRQRIHIAARKTIPSLSIQHHFRHTIRSRRDTWLLHRQRLQQHIGQAFLARRRQRHQIAPFKHVKRLLGKVVQGRILLQSQLLNHAEQHLLVRALSHKQTIDIGQPPVRDQFLGCPEQHRVRLARLKRAYTAHHIRALHARIALLRLHCHVRGALELARVRAIIHVGDQLRRHPDILDDEILRVLCNRDHRGLLAQQSAVERLSVAGIRRASLRDQMRPQLGLGDTSRHKAHVLELAALLPHQRHAHLRRSEDIREPRYERVGIFRNRVRVICLHRGSCNRWQVLQQQRGRR
mmetsp:Transcript_5928/g.9467  ORF Transcript_5928/g.9467 Transcript_5928/m.9467 type:complete len:380 (-) Transcript_5928:239-1378(-)